MTDKNPPLDLVGRAAARLKIDGWNGDEAAPKKAPSTPLPTPAPAAPPASQAAAPAQNEYTLLPEDVAAPRGATNPAHVELDFARMQREGYLTPDSVDERLIEELRLIKRPLLRVAFDSRATGEGAGHVIMVTSSHPGDGKTFVATNLALSIATEQDLFVLAIDSDIRRRGLSRRLGVEDRPGIMDVLLNPSISVAEVMVRTNIPNLAIIPAGQAADGATELFASKRMKRFVEDVTSRYKDRIIIFDTPPVLAASEAGVLASHVGQVAFVVSSGETNKRSIGAALKLINVCPKVHFVLNRISQVTSDDHFGYYSY